MITYIEKTITGTITHGTTSITFTDDFITDNSIIDVYFDDDNIVPTEQTQSSNTLTISIESQSNDVDVAVHITNADTIDYDDVIESHTNALTLLVTKIDGLNASNINYDEYSTLYSAIGDIDELETTSKNLVGAVNECFQSVSSGKSLIASAITDKGVPTLANDTFETMANNIEEIETGRQSAVFSDYKSDSNTSYHTVTISYTATKSGVLHWTQANTTANTQSASMSVTKNGIELSKRDSSSNYASWNCGQTPIEKNDIIVWSIGGRGATRTSVTAYIE